MTDYVTEWNADARKKSFSVVDGTLKIVFLPIEETNQNARRMNVVIMKIVMENVSRWKSKDGRS